jgi:hypothetical protein
MMVQSSNGDGWDGRMSGAPFYRPRLSFCEPSWERVHIGQVELGEAEQLFGFRSGEGNVVGGVIATQANFMRPVSQIAREPVPRSQFIDAVLGVVVFLRIGPKKLFRGNIDDLATHGSRSIPILPTERFGRLVEVVFEFVR